MSKRCLLSLHSLQIGVARLQVLRAIFAALVGELVLFVLLQLNAAASRLAVCDGELRGEKVYSG